MRTCSQCRRAMSRDTSSGEVVFACYCGYREKGSPEDARIAGGVLGAGKTTEMYRKLFRNAPHDPVNQKVARDCPECGLDYMTQIRVGADETVRLLCLCGYRATPAQASGSPVPSR